MTAYHSIYPFEVLHSAFVEAIGSPVGITSMGFLARSPIVSPGSINTTRDQFFTTWENKLRNNEKISYITSMAEHISYNFWQMVAILQSLRQYNEIM